MDPSPENLRSVTHDMRNLLTAVRGHAELALRGLSPEDPAREDVAHVVVVTAAVFELVDQIDGNDSSDTLIATNLDSTIMAMRRLLDALLPSTIELDLQAHSESSFVAVSKLRIERILLNLALNARDAMEDGGTLTIRTAPAADGMAEIVVADSGPGFSEDALEHLFESGFTTKGDRGGSGHGLHALKGILDGIGGSIVVDSTSGEGATVTVELPTVALDEFDELYDRPDRADAADDDHDTDDTPADDPGAEDTPAVEAASGSGDPDADEPASESDGGDEAAHASKRRASR